MKTLFITNKRGTEADIFTVDRLDDEALWLVMPSELDLHFVPNP